MNLRTATVLLLLAATALSSQAADSTPPSEPDKPAVADPLALARARIQARQWTAAIDELRKLNATANADWNNLMGYAQRKQATPEIGRAHV